MGVLIDTSVAILMRDTDSLAGLLSRLEPPACLSAISRVELENGVYRDPAFAAARRTALDLILRHLPTLDFGEREIAAYRSIVAAIGHSRRKTLDRMIAATALVHGLPLVTTNAADFRDIPSLQVEDWRAAEGA